jgi:glucose/arabinose dehydrogenase
MDRYNAIVIAAIAACLFTACDDNGSTGAPLPVNYDYGLENSFPRLGFNHPVDLQNAGDGSDRIFVVEQAGVIKVFANVDTVETAGTFLDISAQVASGGERGLLGLAFHPEYETNGYFYAYYTPNTASVTRLSRFQVSAGDPDAADARSEGVLLEITQDYSNHNGGQIGFGPDGYLYIAVGDEGGAGDPKDQAQDPTTLHGSILRIDVDSDDQGNYGIPPDNPFAINIKGYRPEIFAYGLRNPWRFSFDPVSNRMWAGDVGQGNWEEIDIIEKGRNYGWDCREGKHDFDANQRSAVCDTVRNLVEPVWDYPHGDGNLSVTGGHVYRGPSLSSLAGAYIFADFNSGWIWGLNYDGGADVEVFKVYEADVRVSSFGIDEANELYVCGYDDGHIYRIVRVAASP